MHSAHIQKLNVDKAFIYSIGFNIPSYYLVILNQNKIIKKNSFQFFFSTFLEHSIFNISTEYEDFLIFMWHGIGMDAEVKIIFFLIKNCLFIVIFCVFVAGYYYA